MNMTRTADTTGSVGSSVTVTEYGYKPSGGRRRQIDIESRGVAVVVDPGGEDDDRAAADITESLRRFLSDQSQVWSAMERRAYDAEQEVLHLRSLVANLEQKVPPPSPVRVFNGGCVRFDNKGRLHLMNQREKGWASFSIIVDGWDDLFRRYAVRIGEHGTDEAGAYWLVIPEPIQ